MYKKLNEDETGKPGARRVLGWPASRLQLGRGEKRGAEGGEEKTREKQKSRLWV